MRVVEPKKKPEATEDKPPRRSKKGYVVLLFILAVGVAGLLVFKPATKTAAPVEMSADMPPTSDTNTPAETPDEPLPAAGTLRQFSGNEFRLFYDNLLQPDLEPISTPPPISGDTIADARIRQIAEQRGYKLRANPSVELPSVQGYQLHEVVHQPWLDMQAAAASSGHDISIVSAFRSVDTQRGLFTSRLQAEGVNITDVAAGVADAEVDAVLVTSSIPGYSKHHTGYTIDLVCAGFAFTNFQNSTCFEWLAANNYENAKTYGFIPSYPDDADLQGPDPEAWEYVYVGADLLRN